jgi:hypothetical protein
MAKLTTCTKCGHEYDEIAHRVKGKLGNICFPCYRHQVTESYYVVCREYVDTTDARIRRNAARRASRIADRMEMLRNYRNV